MRERAGGFRVNRTHSSASRPRATPSSFRREPGLGRAAVPGRLGALDPDVLERAGVGEASDQVDSRLLDAGSDAPDERQLVDRDLDHAVVQDALDLVDERLALL